MKLVVWSIILLAWFSIAASGAVYVHAHATHGCRGRVSPDACYARRDLRRDLRWEHQ